MFPRKRSFCLLVVVCCLITRSAVCLAEGNRWTTTPVPGVATVEDASHFSWYRCYVRVPDNWTSDSTSVFTETISLAVEHLTDAHEAYVNGVKVGGGGMPPQFVSSREETHKYKIAKGLLKKGVYNVVAIRVYSPDGPGGFKGRAPIIAGYFKECQLKGDWEFHLGDNADWATTARSEKPEHAVFEEFAEATSALRRPEQFIHGTKLPPEEALKTMKPAADLKVDLLMSEPLVAQPLSLRFDERGRLWVAQYRQYPYPNGIQMISRDKYYRAVYDKVPVAPPNHVPGQDRITVHEDTDGDGVYDQHKTFVDGLNIATSALPGRGGVWVLNSPFLLFYPDADGDCVPDGNPVVHLEGFGLEDVHSVVNSLTWGPDGWLYGAQGSTVSSRVVVKAGQTATDAKDEKSVYCEGAAIWRYHPETHAYEIFAEGGGNAYGIEIDSQGRLYSGHNGSNTRGYYYVQGCFYDKGAEGKYGMLTNPYAFGMVSSMAATTSIKRFSHAFIKYEDVGLPERFHGQLFAVDPLHRNVVLSDQAHTGSSFTTDDVGFAVESEDASFRPVAISVGPDGGVYVADFCEEFIAHGQHYQGQIDPTSGRIYRLRADADPTSERFDLARLSTNELVDLLSHKGKWYRQTALRLLGDRRDSSVNDRLRNNVDQNPGQLALESLWALNILGGFDSDLASKTLVHGNPSVRRWSVRLLGDKQQFVTPPIASQLTEMAGAEPDAEVRLQLAATAKRLPKQLCLSIVSQLLQHDIDATDPAVPLVLWWALESAMEEPNAAVALFQDPGVWKYELVATGIAKKVMRRLATSGTRNEMLAAARLLELAPDETSQQQLVQGFELAFKGRSLSGVPKELAVQLARVGGGSLPLMVRQGDKKAIRDAIALLANADADLAERVEIVRVMGEVKYASCLKPILTVFRTTKDDTLRNASLTALQNYGAPEIATAIVECWDSLPQASKDVAVTTLTSRAEWAQTLLQAVDQGAVEKDSIPLESVRRMTMHDDETVAELIAKHWESLEGRSSQQMKDQMVRLQKVLAAGGGNPYAGKKLFLESCAKCHMLFGKGGRIGPDLTAHKRDDVPAMLLSIINPSAEVREGFETYLVLTDEGRAVSGFLFDQDKRVIVIRGTDGQNVTIARDNIDEMIRQPSSLMPEGLLAKLTDAQVLDLFAYLRTSQPITR